MATAYRIRKPPYKMKKGLIVRTSVWDHQRRVVLVNEPWREISVNGHGIPDKETAVQNEEGLDRENVSQRPKANRRDANNADANKRGKPRQNPDETTKRVALHLPNVNDETRAGERTLDLKLGGMRSGAGPSE